MYSRTVRLGEVVFGEDKFSKMSKRLVGTNYGIDDDDDDELTMLLLWRCCCGTARNGFKIKNKKIE